MYMGIMANIHANGNVKEIQDCVCHFGEGAAVSQTQIDSKWLKQTFGKV